MPDQSIDRIESDLVDIKSTLVAMQARLTSIDLASGEAKSLLRRMPTRWQLFGIIAASTLLLWLLGAVFAYGFLIAAEGDMR